MGEGQGAGWRPLWLTLEEGSTSHRVNTPISRSPSRPPISPSGPDSARIETPERGIPGSAFSLSPIKDVAPLGRRWDSWLPSRLFPGHGASVLDHLWFHKLPRAKGDLDTLTCKTGARQPGCTVVGSSCLWAIPFPGYPGRSSGWAHTGPLLPLALQSKSSPLCSWAVTRSQAGGRMGDLRLGEPGPRRPSQAAGAALRGS